MNPRTHFSPGLPSDSAADHAFSAVASSSAESSSQSTTAAGPTPRLPLLFAAAQLHRGRG